MHIKLKKIHDAILKGGALEENQDKLFEALGDLTPEEADALFYQNKIKDLEDKLSKTEKKLEEANIIIEEKTKPKKYKQISDYDVINFYKFFRTEDGKLIQNDLYIDEEHQIYKDKYYDYRNGSAFDRNLEKNKNYYRDYQKRFIEDWSLSAQELVILYYGVGSGKTMIAVNCAEQYHDITADSHVYFLTPASLVLGTIKEMYDRGIDAKRKNAKGEYIYYFVSYQQLLRSKFDFKEKSLLIIDEAHNLRNIASVEISEKVSARKYKKTGNYSLIGNKLSTMMIEQSSKFLRSIFMTGTLFVNSETDIEALMAIGYKTKPMLNMDAKKYMSIINSPEEFKIYYEGLISFYRIPDNYPTMPKKRFEFVPIVDKELKYDIMVVSKNGNEVREPYFMESRNQSVRQKIDYIIKFLKSHKGEKTLIYSQFLDKSIIPLKYELEKNGFKFGFISGELNQVEKLNVVKKYNTDEIQILIFTLSIKEGISFKETNNIIVFQPYWNYAIMEQILARGIRLNSHKEGNKSTIHLYFLVAVQDVASTAEWFKKADAIMNNDIKKLKVDKKNQGEFSTAYGSRDINLYNRMFLKQGTINIFESKLLALPKFEEVNNNENNDFIKEYKLALLEKEHETGKIPTNKEVIQLKKVMYKEFYEKQLKKIDSRIIRFDKDTKYKTQRNPDVEERASTARFGDKTKEIQELIEQKASLSSFLELFNITKQDITLFQSNFTPEREIDIVIKLSGIEDDPREQLRVLEPTAGIGNFIDHLLKLPNKSNMMIDCNEFVNAYYQIGKTMYDGIDNVKWYNSDFYIYQNKYYYDYILGNPPFNLAYQMTVFKKDKESGELIKNKVDTRLYDVHFVSKAYNMLSHNGVLSMIISDRFMRDQNIPAFIVFNEFLDSMRKIEPSSVSIEKTEEFKRDKGVSKEMETSFGMVCITLKKLDNFDIDLDNKKLRNTSKKGDLNTDLNDE